MATTNAGATLIASLLEADGPYYVGVGNSSTAFSAAQTDLVGTSAREAATASRTSATVTYTAEFGTSVANFAWLEVGLFDASTAGTMVTRKVVALPTKTSSETWTMNLEVVVAAA
jgi:hypothetical protein